MDVVEDSHGYCRVIVPTSPPQETNSCIFTPVFILKYQLDSTFDGTTSYLEYLYSLAKYEDVVVFGPILLKEATDLKYSIKKALFELLVRSNVHLGIKSTALYYLNLILEGYSSEDPGRDYLKIWTYSNLGMHHETVLACREYLNIRSGDLGIIRQIIESSLKIGIDCSDWERSRDQIVNCYLRGRE